MRFLVALLALAASAIGQPNYDLLIRDGRIVDGAGGPWYGGDVGIRGDTIVAMGDLHHASAAVTIEAKGLVIAPGFIDIHTHSRRGIFAVPTAENYVRQGVTTLMEGNDGSSPLPLAPFLAKVAGLHPAVNWGTFVGQGTIRQEVIGTVNRKATAEEIAKMCGLARQAMREGAFGLSTGLYYVPGNYTPTEEVIEIARVVGQMGGMHISHMRDEAAGVLDGVRETIRIGEEGHLPTQITHHKIMGAAYWGKSEDTLRLVEEARARGVDVTIDQYPYTATATGIITLIPQWAQEGGQKAMVNRLHDPEMRARVKQTIVDKIRNDRGGGDPRNVVMSSCGFDSKLAGKNLAQITESRGMTQNLENAAETTMWIVEHGGCSAIFHAIDEKDVERIMRYPFTMIGSDGEVPVFGVDVPHPRSYGTFARVLGRYVRERHTLTLEDAVHRMTGITAARLKLWDRGILRPGMKADVVVFDPETIGDRATFEQPHQYAVGVTLVVVNGKPILRDGKITTERPGRVLYGSSTVAKAH
jgi:dihydroorotase/N-acyl-D-amino-acid deacylase